MCCFLSRRSTAVKCAFAIGDCDFFGTQIVDMFAAATYLAGALEPWVALIVFITIGSYIPLTIIVTEWRGNFRREMNRTENARSARVTDALLNWWVSAVCWSRRRTKDTQGHCLLLDVVLDGRMRLCVHGGVQLASACCSTLL
jgi:hypothetical protein